MSVALIDAGPLAALFNPKEFSHQHYVSLLENSRNQLRLQTTWPCVTEAAHLLSAPKRWALLDWLGQGVVTVFPFDQYDLVDMLPIMEKYTQLPRTDMDLADASLWWVATQGVIRKILTLDVRDFSRYRLGDGSSFEIY